VIYSEAKLLSMLLAKIGSVDVQFMKSRRLEDLSKRMMYNAVRLRICSTKICRLLTSLKIL
jgi:hypothetical protein